MMDTGTIIGVVVLLGFGVLSWVNMFAKEGGKKRLRQVLAEGALVLDVRSAAECKEGMYPGARNIPLDKLQGQGKKLGDTDRPIVVYCASGARAGQAVGMLRGMGYRNVINGGSYHNLTK